MNMTIPRVTLAILTVGFVMAASQADAQWRNDSPRTLFSWKASGPEPMLELGGLVTDRPDFTEASSTVGSGVIQLESGYTYTRNSDNGVLTESHSYGEPLLRIGALYNWLEFRIAASPVEQKVGSTRNRGTEDLYLGFKIGLTPQEDWLPEMAIIPQATVATGSSAFTSNKTLLGANLVYSWELCEDLSFGGSTQVNDALEGATEYTEWAQSLTLAGSLTEKIGAYGEWYALFPDSGAGVDLEQYFNGGLTYSWNEDVQFDIRAGVGLNDAADDFFIGTGISIRLR